MTTTLIPLRYRWQLEENGTVTIARGDTIIATCPNVEAGKDVLAWMRLSQEYLRKHGPAGVKAVLASNIERENT